ncbi:MAG: DUF1800 domain-containing protein [Chitinophagaceae bacterium]
MGNYDRRQFLGAVLDATKANPAADDAIFEKYANHSLPRGLQKTTGTLTSYSGVWTQAEVIHLLRRTTFGVRPGDVQTLLAMTPGNAVDYLFSNAPSTAPAPPLNNYYSGGYTDPTGVLPETTWVNAAVGDGTVNSKRRSSLKSWWMGVLLNQNCSILEKMNFFWHNHFATQITVIGDARIAYFHHAMLRANALGNFKTLATLVTKNPAMLIYLNGAANTAAAPDENYGREFQELFTVSKYNNPDYTEDDVKAAAHVLTGWQLNYATNPVSSKFTPSRHDPTNKQFTSFYNNTVITGQAGAAGANETDALINMIFTVAATQVANWICTKLYRYFVYYDTVTDPSVQANVINGMATTLVANNWDVVPVLKQLLKSQHFFDTNSRGCYIRTPLDFFVGSFRTFGVGLPTSFDTAKTYGAWNVLVADAAANGLDLGEPPNVSGLTAYSQSPEFYELWINSNTYPHRLEFLDTMLGAGFRTSGSYIKFDVLAFAATCANVSDPDLLVQYCCDMLLGIDLSTTQKDAFKVNILLSGQTTNYYWTQAWSDYTTSPSNVTYKGIVTTRISSLLTGIMHSAEHMLA